MKKNPIIRWASGISLLLGGSLVALAAMPAADASVVPAEHQESVAPQSFLHCDEVRIQVLSHRLFPLVPQRAVLQRLRHHLRAHLPQPLLQVIRGLAFTARILAYRSGTVTGLSGAGRFPRVPR